jgi:lipopolysaccharide/colanic/teichoic acid biosynthesis glycosyltransferase
VKSENIAAPVHRLENLLVRPLPWWKRAIDIVGAMVGLMLASPVLAVAALLIKYGSKGPVIFTQQRAGLGGRPFTIYKFRTMVVDAEEQKAALRKFSEQDGPGVQADQRPAHHAGRAVPPQDQHRRAPPALERA